MNLKGREQKQETKRVWIGSDGFQARSLITTLTSFRHFRSDARTVVNCVVWLVVLMKLSRGSVTDQVRRNENKSQEENFLFVLFI